MGCDIHCFSEVKVNDKWEHMTQIEFERSYYVFGYMVKDHSRTPSEINYIPLAEARGLPKDINPLTKILLQNRAEHTFSWLNRNEMELLYNFSSDVRCYPYDFRSLRFMYFDLDKGFIKSIYEEIQDVRIIFGFDN